MEFEHTPIYAPFNGWASNTSRQYAPMKLHNGPVFIHDEPMATSISEDAVSPFAAAQSFGDWTCSDAYEHSMPAIELPQRFDHAMDTQPPLSRHHSIATTLAPHGSIVPGHLFGQQQSGAPTNHSWSGNYSRCNSETDLKRLTSLQPKVIPSNHSSSSRAPSLTSLTSTRSSDLSNPASPTDVKMEGHSAMKRKSEDFTAQGITPLVTEPPPKRKRGRPKLNREISAVSATNTLGSKDDRSGSSTRAPARLPHNQVERRYREGLNAELEKLRSAVPTLHYGEVDPANATPKASKATVLAAAVDYIKSLEAQRECLFAENERLRTDGQGRGGWMLGGMG